MKKKYNPGNPYQIFDKQTKSWVKVTPEYHKEHHKMCTKIRKYEQYHKRCMCPRHKWWLCDGMCQDCEFHAPGDILSLDMMKETSNKEIQKQFNVDPSTELDFANTVCNSVDLKQLMNNLIKIMPDAEKIITLRLLKYTDTYIAKKLGIPRSTMLSRLNKALNTLGADIKDFT